MGSLVLNEASSPAKIRRSTSTPTQCLVHQFLESQRKGAHKGGGLNRQRSGGSGHSHGNSHAVPVDDDSDTAEQQGLHRLVEPKGSSLEQLSHEQRAVVDKSVADIGSGSIGEDGQADQKRWARDIVRSPSQLDNAAVDDVVAVRAGVGAGARAGVAESVPEASAPVTETTVVEERGQEEEHEAVHSRLLTKKQLSEMAWGVRELSRRLGSMRLKFRVKTIFLLTKIYDEDLIPKTRELTRWLLDRRRDVRHVVYLERALRDNVRFDAPGLLDELRRDYAEAGEPEGRDDEGGAGGRGLLAQRLRYWDEDMCRTRPHTFDFVITLGGDGTVLYASWLFQRIVPPVLSFALGSLGFLTKFDFDAFPATLSTAFRAGVTVSLRLRFEGTIMRSQERTRPVVADAAADKASSLLQWGDHDHHAGADGDVDEEGKEEGKDKKPMSLTKRKEKDKNMEKQKPKPYPKPRYLV